MFELDGVELEFEPEAVEAIADKAIKRNTGARGLRSIIEETMTDTMFDVPSDEEIVKCVVTADSVDKGTPPKMIHQKTEKVGA